MTRQGATPVWFGLWVARQHRFNRLFLEAHEVFISRDRENYVLNHLMKSDSKSS